MLMYIWIPSINRAQTTVPEEVEKQNDTTTGYYGEAPEGT